MAERMEKCQSCFTVRRCIYTVRMQQQCGGPFSNRTEQTKFLMQLCKTRGENESQRL